MKMSKWMMSIVLCGFLISCTRAANEEKSSLSIAIPANVKSQKLGALAFDSLSHISINISGEGMGAPVVFNWDRENNGPAGTMITPPSSFSFEVPKGNDRLIQVLAVYSESSATGEGEGAMQFFYGDVTRTLTLTTEEVPINVESVGKGATITSGNIQGRYLTSPNDGPTSRVDVVFVPPGGKTPMIVERTMMVSGWFQFFGLIGAKFGYRLNDGTMLWGGPVDLTETSFPVSNQVMRVAVPIRTKLDTYSGGTTSTRQEDPSIYIYGFFGDSSLVSSRAICKSIAGNSLTRILKFGTTTPLTVTDSNSADPTNLFDTSLSYINVRGGVAAGGSVPCDTQANISANLYNTALGFQPSLLENGNDNSAGFRLPFQLQQNNNGGGANMLATSIVDANNISITGTLLPGISNVLDNFIVFKAINLGANFHHRSSFAPCDSLTGMGYSRVGDTPVNGSSYTATLPLSDAEASGGAMFALCPTKSGAPVGPGVWVQASYMRNTGGCTGSCGGGGGGGTPTKVGFQGTVALTIGQCSFVNLQLMTDTNAAATASDPININLAATGSSSFFAPNDYSCSGGAISLATIQPGSGWAGVNFMTNAAPETDIILTPTDAASVLTSLPMSVRARAAGSVTNIQFFSNIQGMNLGTCLPMQVKSVQTNSSMVSYSGPLTVTATGITIYTDAGCTVAGSAPNLTGGMSNFYVKGSTAGWGNLQASATIDSLNFVSHYGISLYPVGEPSHFTLDFPTSDYLYINQCMPINVYAKDDAGTPQPIPLSQIIHFNSSGGGTGNNFYTDSNCTASMTDQEQAIAGGQSTSTIYYKPQNYGQVFINAQIYGNNYYLMGGQTYSIGNLWMHVLMGGFNSSWYNTTCSPINFELRNHDQFGSGIPIQNLSGSAVSIDVNTNRPTTDGGLFSANDCSDPIASIDSASIAPLANTGVIYMKSNLADGTPYVSVFPSYGGSYSSVYSPGNTLSLLSIAWCPAWDGGGTACAMSLAVSGGGISNNIANFGAVSTVSNFDMTMTLTNYGPSPISIGGPSFSGANSSDFTFVGGSFPGTGGTCGGPLASSASCTAVVRFVPGAVGARNATLNLLYGSTNKVITLQGSGY